MGRDDSSVPSIPEAKVVLNAGLALGNPHHHQGFKPYAIVPEGAALVPLEAVQPPVLHDVESHPKFRDVDSFNRYVSTFQDDRSQLFADERNGTVLAVLDYHLDQNTPQRCLHRATLTAEASPEWKEWKANNGKGMTQEAFAAFIEDQAPFISRPAPAEMLEVASSMQATSSHSFSKAIRLDNGQVQLQYVENIDGRAGPKGSLDIPKTFDVQLRPFLGTSPRKVEARFRYRLEGGRLTVWYDLFRADDIQREAFEAILLTITDEIQIKPYLGGL